jgi:hypothetical protein
MFVDIEKVPDGPEVRGRPLAPRSALSRRMVGASLWHFVLQTPLPYDFSD